MRVAAAVLLSALCLLVDPAASESQTDERRVFSVLLSTSNPFSEALPFEDFTDVAVLPDGRLAALPAWYGREIYVADMRGRTRRLPTVRFPELEDDNALIAGPDGSLWFSERGRVLRRAPDGRTSTVAGSVRRHKASGDGGPAVGAGMTPLGLALLSDGSLLVADGRSHRVRAVTGGVIRTVAGTGVAGQDGDGGPADRARITRPTDVSAFRDGAYLIAHGRRQLIVRRVDRDGTISTVAGGGTVPDYETCTRTPRPATSLRFLVEGFGGIEALQDGSFLISSAGGLHQVSPDGLVRALMCPALFGPRYRPDGRDLFVAGRLLTSAYGGGFSSDVALGVDGTIVLNEGDGSRLTMIATPGASQRLGIALSPATKTSVHSGLLTLVSSDRVAIDVRIHRRGREVTRVQAEVPAGESVVRLPERMEPGLHRIRVIASTADGRTATHELWVLGRPRISVDLAKRLLRDFFFDEEIGEGYGSLRLSRCRHHGPRRVRCRARGWFDDDPFRGRYGVTLRRDGVLTVARSYRPDRRLYVTAIGP